MFLCGMSWCAALWAASHHINNICTCQVMVISLDGIFWYLLVSFEPVEKIPKDTKRYQVSFGIFWYLFNRFKRYQKIPKDTVKISQDTT